MKKLTMFLLTGLLILPLATGCGSSSGRRASTPVAAPAGSTLAAFLEDHVYFDYDRYNIRPDAAATIKLKADYFSQVPRLKAEIQGHCDERGTEAYNMALGDRRAKAVYNYATSLGVDGSRMSVVSYGKERPLDPGHNEAAWSRNRRAQFVITAQ